MARSLNILILTLFGTGILLFGESLRPHEAQAWELLTGRIKTLVEVNGMVHLTFITDSQPDESQKSVTPDISIQTTINLEVPRAELPPRLKEGDLIRVWRESDNQLKPLRISYSRGYDPTGVRSRLSGCGLRSSAGRSGGKGSHGGR